MSDVITTPALGKLYNCKGKQLKRLRRQLQIMEYLGISRRVGSQTYSILKELPSTASGVNTRYNQRFCIDLDSAVAGVEAELEELAGEMVEWRDNLDQHEGLSQTEKYSQVQEAADNLEYLDVASVAIPEAVGQLEFFDVPVYDTALMEGRSCYLGRGRRAANLANTLRGVVDVIAAEFQEDVSDDIQEFVNEMTNIVDELESIDFPTMYG